MHKMRCSSVLEYLAYSACEFANKTAFVDCEENGYTFAEIRRASRAAGVYIRRTLDEKTERPIAVIVDRNVKCIPAFLGAALSGNFYIPVDSTLPPERMRAMLETAQPEMVIHCEEDFCGEIGSCPNVQIDEALAGAPDEDGALPVIGGDMPFYGIFTSGSTGVSKLVIKSHRAVAAFIDVYAEEFGFSQDDILGNQIPFYFDASTKDLFVTLKCGATTHVISKGLFAQPGKLAQFLVEKQITSITWVPSALAMLSRFGVLAKIALPSLRRVLFVGEAMQVRQMNIWYEALPGVRFVNLYGATENAGNCLFHVVNRRFELDECVPIGKPFRGVKVFLLDEADRPISPDRAGESGEICISGEILAIGYYKNPQATAEKFCESRLPEPGYERMYRTGDLAHYDPNGDLVFDSRKDHQIKLNGYRIELGEIEHAACMLDGVSGACCIFDAERKKIVMYYAAQDLEEEALKAHLKEILHTYMLPARYIRLDEMPLNPNGKIHRVYLQTKYLEAVKQRANP